MPCIAHILVKVWLEFIETNLAGLVLHAVSSHVCDALLKVLTERRYEAEVKQVMDCNT
jgi:hypothetical protein